MLRIIIEDHKPYTMRCQNCGWTNSKDRLKCEKCNYPFDGTVNKFLSQDDLNDANNQPTGIAGTIKGSNSSIDPWDAPNQGPINVDTPRDPTRVVPDEAEYKAPPSPIPPTDSAPYVPVKTKDITRERIEEKPKITIPDAEEKRKNMPQEPAPKVDFKKTFDPSRLRTGSQKFSLIPLPKEGEQELETIAFKENSVELNRANVDPTNFSITSKCQAKIEFIDGKWLIVDTSDQETTFIQLRRPFELQKGDIIQLGNRKFIFEGND